MEEAVDCDLPKNEESKKSLCEKCSLVSQIQCKKSCLKSENQYNERISDSSNLSKEFSVLKQEVINYLVNEKTPNKNEQKEKSHKGNTIEIQKSVDDSKCAECGEMIEIVQQINETKSENYPCMGDLDLHASNLLCKIENKVLNHIVNKCSFY